MEMVRTFIAITLPMEVKSEMAAVSSELSQQCPPHSVRWVKTAQMHLTLRFLGDTAVSTLRQLTSDLDRIASWHNSFGLKLNSLGCFPNKKRTRVIWIGLGGELDAAQKLQAEIETAVVAHGWQVENRPFQPHLTIGRVKNSVALNNLKWDTAVKQVEFEVTAVHLVESQLQPSGAIYTIRHTSQLLNP